MNKPYEVLEPSQTYSLNIITTINNNYDNYKPIFMEYTIEENGYYYITLNGVRQQKYEYPCMKNDIIQMWVTKNKIISTIKNNRK